MDRPDVGVGSLEIVLVSHILRPLVHSRLYLAHINVAQFETAFVIYRVIKLIQQHSFVLLVKKVVSLKLLAKGRATGDGSCKRTGLVELVWKVEPCV